MLKNLKPTWGTNNFVNTLWICCLNLTGFQAIGTTQKKNLGLLGKIYSANNNQTAPRRIFAIV